MRFRVDDAVVRDAYPALVPTGTTSPDKFAEAATNAPDTACVVLFGEADGEPAAVCVPQMVGVFVQLPESLDPQIGRAHV